MSIREAVEKEVIAKTGECMTEDIFKEALMQAVDDINYNKVSFGRSISFDYVVYAISTAASILININKKAPLKSA